MAKERNLPSKATLTTSDFIRVVGSDNASYKQPMTDLMTTTGIARTWIATGVDLNTLTPNATSGNGYYRGNDISTMTNKPSAEVNAFPWALNAINVNTYIKQILHIYTAQANIVVYERIQRYSSGSPIWGNWEKMPTRAEVDALNSKTVLTQSISVPSNGSATVTLPSVTGSFLCAWRGTNAVWRGLALITKASNSDGIATVITSNMGTVTESGNTLTFTNLHGTTSQTYYIEVNRIGN